VSASLIAASGIAIGTIELPGVGILAIALADISGIALRLLGIPVSLDGAVINASGFLAVIAQQCTAIELLLVFSTLALICPVSLKARAWALLLGIPALCLLNLVRVISLLLIGIGFPHHLDLAHLVIWQSIMVVAAFAMWLLWFQRAYNAERSGRLAE
jgi:exosortase/archaeosortase family protein